MSMQQQIEEKLAAGIECKHLNVVNESHMHSRGTESHFKVIVVSEEFADEAGRLHAGRRGRSEVLENVLFGISVRHPASERNRLRRHKDRRP